MDKPRRKSKKELRDRVANLRTLLPEDWKERLLAKHPEYDRFHMFSFVNNVYRGASTDEQLTEILESIASEFQNAEPSTPTVP